MYVTAILMLLLLICLILSERKNYKGLCSFDKFTTLPLRGLLALLIISHHLGQRSDIYIISQFTSGIGYQIVAVFFFISGYGLCVSYISKGRDYLNGFLPKRLGKLLPKFIILTCCMVLYYHFCGSMNIGSQVSKLRTGWTALPFSWFIYAIIYVYIAFYVCATFSKTPKQIGLLFTLTIMAYIVVFFKIIHFSPYWYFTIITVVLGYFAALYEKKIDEIIRHKIFFYSTLIGLLFLIFCAMAKIRVPLIVFVLNQLWILAQAFSVYAIIRTLGFSQSKWLRKIGVFSLELYLIHGLPLVFGQNLGLKNWTLWAFTYALSVPSAIFLNRLYDFIFKRNKPLVA